MPIKLTSPPFEYEIPEGLEVNANYTANLEMVANTTADYVPFNSIVIDNFSAQTVKLLYGSGHYVYVRGNSMAEIEQNGIRSFTVQNVSGVPTDGIIVVYVQKKITADIALEAIARKVPVETLMGV